MWTYPKLKELALALGMRGVTFDQCRTNLRWKKTTFLLATPGLAPMLQARFGELVCNHRADEHDSLVGPRKSDGSFPSEESSEYTADMCEHIASAIDEWIQGNPAPACAVATVAEAFAESPAVVARIVIR